MNGEEPEAELYVWTDVDPAHEDDFNRWYDREHMEERIAIPGFRWGRRYRTVTAGMRRYLALYRAKDLGVFTSDVYRQAFTRQTDWSNINFTRMRGPSRRVMRVTGESGFGTGGHVALATCKGSAIDDDVRSRLLGLAAELDGCLAVHCLEPDPDLSTPLPAETLEGRVLEAATVFDLTSAGAARAAADAAREALGDRAKEIATFELLWELRAEDL